MMVGSHNFFLHEWGIKAFPENSCREIFFHLFVTLYLEFSRFCPLLRLTYDTNLADTAGYAQA